MDTGEVIAIVVLLLLLSLLAFFAGRQSRSPSNDVGGWVSRRDTPIAPKPTDPARGHTMRSMGHALHGC